MLCAAQLVAGAMPSLVVVVVVAAVVAVVGGHAYVVPRICLTHYCVGLQLTLGCSLDHHSRRCRPSSVVAMLRLP